MTLEKPDLYPKPDRSRVAESLKTVLRFNAAVFAALALHAGGLFIGLDKDEIIERAQNVLTDLKDGKDQAIDFLNPGNLGLVVKSLERGTEEKEKIDNLENFYFVADELKNNFTPEQVAAAQQNMDAEIATAEEMKAGGADQRKIVDYILSQQGEYDETQNSLIAMMDVPLAKRKGSCHPRFLRTSAEFAAVFPDDYAAGRIKVETFDGADLDGDGKLDTVAHVRTVITQPDGKTLIAEGKKSYIDNPDPKAPKPTTEEVSTIVTRSFLAHNDLYVHPEGPTRGKYVDQQYKSFLDMPGSPATYAGGLVMSQPVPSEKPAEKIPPAKPKPIEAPLVSEHPEEFKVTLLEDPVVPKVLKLADLQDPNFDVKQFNDIDPDFLQYAFDHYDTLPHAEELFDALHGVDAKQGLIFQNNQFTSLVHLSDPKMAKLALRVGFGEGEGGLERPHSIFYVGDVQTLEAAQELTKYAGVCPYYVTLTTQPSLEVAQELGKTGLAALTLDFVPSQEILIALAPIERIEIRSPITNAQQIAPLVDWLSVDSWVDNEYTSTHRLTIRGAIPEELQKALEQRFGYQVSVIY